MWTLRNFGWDAHGYDAPSALRRAAELFEGPLAEVPPRDTGVKHVDFTKKKWGIWGFHDQDISRLYVISCGDFMGDT